MNSIEGKVAFITGGTSGIGLGIAYRLAQLGARVILGHRSDHGVDTALGKLRGLPGSASAQQVEVRDRASLDAAAERILSAHGKVHLLINNAGVASYAPLVSTMPEEWDRMMSTNVTGVLNGIQTFLPLINQHGEGGHVSATASIMGLAVPGAGSGAYIASKFAVVGLMEALRAELAGGPIGVSVICPGIVRSNLQPNLREHPLGLDPFEAGRRIVHGIRANALYIMTDDSFAPFLEARCAAIRAAISSGGAAPAGTVQRMSTLIENSIYG